MSRIPRDRLRTPPPPRRMLRLPAVAAELGVGPRKVRAMIRSGELVAHDLSTAGSQRPQYAISREDLDAWLASRRVVPVPPDPPPRRRRRSPAGITQYV